jgi:hypothetical protein
MDDTGRRINPVGFGLVQVTNALTGYVSHGRLRLEIGKTHEACHDRWLLGIPRKRQRLAAPRPGSHQREAAVLSLTHVMYDALTVYQDPVPPARRPVMPGTRDR